MVDTIRNMVNRIQFDGPPIGGVVALGAAVASPYVRRADAQEELKGIRNEAVICGIIVARLPVVISGESLAEIVNSDANDASTQSSEFLDTTVG
jgi:hypothetical protein